MTAPAAAPASGPMATPSPRASPHPPADRFAFGAVLAAEKTYVCSVIRNMIASGFGAWTANARALCQ